MNWYLFSKRFRMLIYDTWLLNSALITFVHFIRITNNRHSKRKLNNIISRSNFYHIYVFCIQIRVRIKVCNFANSNRYTVCRFNSFSSVHFEPSSTNDKNKTNSHQTNRLSGTFIVFSQVLFSFLFQFVFIFFFNGSN